MDALLRLSRRSSEEQTRQLQPTIGTPVDVPLPRIVIFITVNFPGIFAKITEFQNPGKAVFPGRLILRCNQNEYKAARRVATEAYYKYAKGATDEANDVIV